MDNYTLHRGRLIDRIQLVVNNFDASKAFYTAVLAELKIPLVITDDDYIWADVITAHLPNEPIIPDTMPLLFWIRTVTTSKLFTMVRAIAVPVL